MQKKPLIKFSIFLIETLSKLRIEGNSLNLTKDSYQKPSVSIKYSGERQLFFYGQRSYKDVLVQHFYSILHQRFYISNQEVKLSLYTYIDSMITLCRKIDSTKKLLELILVFN